MTLAIRWPDMTPDRVIDDYVNLMDLAPTFLDIAGLPMPPGLSGRSLAAPPALEQGGRSTPPGPGS